MSMDGLLGGPSLNWWSWETTEASKNSIAKGNKMVEEYKVTHEGG